MMNSQVKGRQGMYTILGHDWATRRVTHNCQADLQEACEERDAPLNEAEETSINYE